MPRVPYEPFPTTQPQSPGEGISISTPGAAFGENIGAALQHLGTTTEQVGGELFQRAIALQDLRNETAARQADADYAEKQGELHAQYTSLEGKAAVDGLQKYITDSKALRDQFRNNLGTPNAQKMYDSSSLSFLQRNIFNAAGHAGNENKRYVVGTAQAQADTTARTFVNPSSDGEFNDKLSTIDSSAETLAGAQNWSDDQKNDWLLNQKSHLWSARLTQIGTTDAPKALDMLDANKQGMTQPDYDRTQQRLLSQNRAVGSQILADKVYDPNKSLTTLEGEVKDQADKFSHGDPEFLPHALSAIRGKYNQDKYATLQENHSNEQTVIEAVAHL